jgi:catechol 2,3-dioxygenase-like lactoylglutathione lyase family enzyme
MSTDTLAGNERLVIVAPEFLVRNLQASLQFYTKGLGFEVLRRDPDFAVVGIGEAHILLVVAHETPEVKAWLESGPRGVGFNVRIMVDDVDAIYKRAKAASAFFVDDIADRAYGLRDFMIADVDGFVLRFAAPVVR